MTTPDFRSDRMDSIEGKGRARQVWDSYRRAIDKTVMPVVLPVARPGAEALARKWMVDLLGFWMLWHLYGGFEGLEEFGMHPSTIWRKVSRFRQVFGKHPDEFEFPGVTIDPKAYWAAAGIKGRRGSHS